ncbi:hypothetical protein [Vibrio crassostreae]|uniref:hypothetical protein n=1 Tax=Vibrio crassostreae TaxID=246167 RepID=UPI001B30FFAD|nr:hypothetical protein [Vibrio crassostreae]
MQVKNETITEMFDNNVRIDELYHLGTQVILDSVPDTVRDLILENWYDFWSVMGVKPDEDMSDDEILEELAWDLRNRYRKTGFIAKVAYPAPRNFSDDYSSWDFSWGFYSTKLVYGESMQECCDKALSAQQEYIERQIAEAKREKGEA